MHWTTLAKVLNALIAFFFICCLSPYKQHSYSFVAWPSNTQKHKRVEKSNPQLKLCVILAIGEPMEACNLNVHMTSQARNLLVLQPMLYRTYVNNEGISTVTLCPSVYGLVCASLFGVCTHTYAAAC